MYRDGLINLAVFSQKAETLIEKTQPSFSPTVFLKAMNCVYLIEEVNALVSDENRTLSEIEQHDINTQLVVLESLFAVGAV